MGERQGDAISDAHKYLSRLHKLLPGQSDTSTHIIYNYHRVPLDRPTIYFTQSFTGTPAPRRKESQQAAAALLLKFLVGTLGDPPDVFKPLISCPLCEDLIRPYDMGDHLSQKHY